MNDQKNKAYSLSSDVTADGDASLDVIDLSNMYQQIELALDYIRNSRSDVEAASPAGWIHDVYNAVDDAGKLMKNLEIIHEADLQEWTDENGSKRFMLLRSQDPEKFDETVSLYTKANKLFSDYLGKHIELIEAGKV